MSELLLQALQTEFGDKLQSATIAEDEVTIEVSPQNLHAIALTLRENEQFSFEQLTDLCGVDYEHYGLAHWQTDAATSTGFDRAVTETPTARITPWNKPRFAVVTHLLSVKHNWRLRLRVFVDEKDMSLPSISDIWSSANWNERETFDMFGIFFSDHPDLRRILTDYGFIGHPFRKDFPLSGQVEVRYDAKEGRVVYEKVDIEPRTLVPKVIRTDNRYLNTEQDKANG